MYLPKILIIIPPKYFGFSPQFVSPFDDRKFGSTCCHKIRIFLAQNITTNQVIAARARSINSYYTRPTFLSPARNILARTTHKPRGAMNEPQNQTYLWTIESCSCWGPLCFMVKRARFRPENVYFNRRHLSGIHNPAWCLMLAMCFGRVCLFGNIFSGETFFWMKLERQLLVHSVVWNSSKIIQDCNNFDAICFLTSWTKLYARNSRRNAP